ncbi:hypothetical protein ACFE04_016608 [Oxalis oulophora]
MGLLSVKSILILLFILSAIPIAYIISLEVSTPSTHTIYYHSSGGFFRECAKWDNLNRRFLISHMEGGISQISLPNEEEEEEEEEASMVVNDVDLAGNASLGIVIDYPRNRLLVVTADLIGNKYSALVAYDLSTWNRLFLSQLSGPSDGKAFADDVAVDTEGNAYVTDAKNSKIWKVGPTGELLSIITNPLFTPKEWYKNLIALNGIVYHPNGYLLVIHTFSGNLYKVDISKDTDNYEVKLIKVTGGSLMLGDGLELLSPNKLVVAGNPSARLVESSDEWETAAVVAKFSGPMHRMLTAATVKDGKVYLNHMIGMGYPKKKHAIVEAVF